MTPGKSSAPDLPLPDDAALAHSQRVQARVFEHIDQGGGAITFDEYMNSVLYEPGLGYYTAGSTKLGAAGDFITAPELSDLFGRCLARQAEALLAQGVAPAILEFGAGSGRLCAQILEVLADIRHYHILETSADLRERQQEFLRERLSVELFHKVEWLETLPQGFDGIVVANEVLDAMPVQLVCRRTDWVELGVTRDGDGLGWCELEARPEVREAMHRIEQAHGELPEGYCTEWNPHYRAWFGALAEACERVVVLILDYGYEQPQYYAPWRSRGTLTCHFRHHVHADPLRYPGLQDVTAFVDFDACADAAEQAGFTPQGLIEQGRFLVANGLLDDAQQLARNADPLEQLKISQQVATLSLPQEMGEKFKVMGLTRNLSVKMPALGREFFDG